jgi:hypothetical protein
VEYLVGGCVFEARVGVREPGREDRTELAGVRVSAPALQGLGALCLSVIFGRSSGRTGLPKGLPTSSGPCPNCLDQRNVGCLAAARKDGGTSMRERGVVWGVPMGVR